MSRNTLHLTRLQDFKNWCDTKGIKWRDRDIGYEVLQVQPVGSTLWYGVYRRDRMPEHYSTDLRMDGMLRNFLKETKNGRRDGLAPEGDARSAAERLVESTGEIAEGHGDVLGQRKGCSAIGDRSSCDDCDRSQRVDVSVPNCGEQGGGLEAGIQQATVVDSGLGCVEEDTGWFDPR